MTPRACWKYNTLSRVTAEQSDAEEVAFVMTTYAVLQKLPPEALDADEARYGAVDVLTVGTQLGVEAFLTDYRRRYQAACQEWAAWDSDMSREWDSTFDLKQAELCDRYAVSTLLEDVVFEIVPVGLS